PRGRVARGRPADAGDDRAGLRLVAVLPEVRGLQGADQERLVQGRVRGEQTVVEGGRGGAVTGELAVGGGPQQQGLGVLGVEVGRPLQAGGFGGVVDVFGRRVGAHG